MVDVASPSGLSQVAADCWVQIVADLPGPLTGADRKCLEMFCGHYGRLVDARARIDAEGSVVLDAKGVPIPHPALRVESAADAACRGWVDRRPDLLARGVDDGDVDDSDAWLSELQA